MTGKKLHIPAETAKDGDATNLTRHCHFHGGHILCKVVRYRSLSYLVIIDRIAKQVRSMNWRKPSICLSVRLSVCPASTICVKQLRLAVAFSLVSHKPLMIQESNVVSLLTFMSSSRPIQNLVTLTLTSRFSEHRLILTLTCSLSHHLSCVCLTW